MDSHYQACDPLRWAVTHFVVSYGGRTALLRKKKRSIKAPLPSVANHYILCCCVSTIRANCFHRCHSSLYMTHLYRVHVYMAHRIASDYLSPTKAVCLRVAGRHCLQRANTSPYSLDKVIRDQRLTTGLLDLTKLPFNNIVITAFRSTCTRFTGTIRRLSFGRLLIHLLR